MPSVYISVVLCANYLYLCSIVCPVFLFRVLDRADLVTARMVIILRIFEAQKISERDEEEQGDIPDNVDESKLASMI